MQQDLINMLKLRNKNTPHQHENKNEDC